MADPEQVAGFRDDFYRDGFRKIILLVLCAVAALALMTTMAVYLFLLKPLPMTFNVGEEWRILPPVPLDQPYRSTPDVLQWVSDVFPKSFQYDFDHYEEQLKVVAAHFTTEGWSAFLMQLNNYVNYNTVHKDKLFVSAVPDGAPFIINQGVVLGRYGWWVQVPLVIQYVGNKQPYNQPVTFQILVVRVPTLNNLSGIGIQNVTLEKPTNNPSDNGGV